MAYQVKFTEATNSAKPAIVVEDKTINAQTDLNFVGQNYAGYAPLLAENFLHLLENFAKSTAPATPVEGQLWYDNTTGENILKVFDGTTWNPTGSIKKAVAAPDVANSTNGDLWVNPVTRQLYIFSGITWELIGPQFSSGVKTGPLVELFVDTLVDVTNNQPRSVVSLYASNERLAIISADSFIPKSYTIGFARINRGINLSTINSSATSLIKLWGTARSADSLVVGSTEVNASNFLRADVASTTTAALNIQSDSGISVGSDLSFSINATTSVIGLTAKNKNIGIKVQDNQGVTTVIHVDTQKRVGIGSNNTSPLSTLDVGGDALISTSLTIGSADDVVPGSVTAYGNMTVFKTSTFKDIATFEKPIRVYNLNGGAVILPQYTVDQLVASRPMYDIGSSILPFRNMYAKSFVGDLTGSVTGTLTGNVTGSASYLKNAVNMTLTGDVTTAATQFNGQSDVTFATTISQGFITSKDPADASFDTDQILTFRTKTGLQRTTKALFLQSVPSVPAGAILPFAGTVIPDGYLLCDGSELLISSYTKLYATIEYAYRDPALLVGVGTFALPDLRGRFPLGRDNMDNGLTIRNASGSTVNGGGNRNGTIDNASNPANRVQNPNSKKTGASSGTDTLGIAAQSGATGDKMLENSSGSMYSIMNPYQTINYIIFTGVIQ